MFSCLLVESLSTILATIYVLSSIIDKGYMSFEITYAGFRIMGLLAGLGVCIIIQWLNLRPYSFYNGSRVLLLENPFSWWSPSDSDHRFRAISSAVYNACFVWFRSKFMVSCMSKALD